MKTRNFDRGRNSAPVATKFRLSPRAGDDSDTFSIHVNILYYDYLTVGITFFSCIKSGVQTGSAQLARAKSTRVLSWQACANAHGAAHMDTCSRRALQPRRGAMSPKCDDEVDG